ncbi:hypothetical protein D3C72_1304340 [compost metagenome]
MVSSNKPTAPQKMAPMPICHEMPIAPTTTNAKNALRPIAGASATGRFASRPMKMLPKAAIRQVVTNTACVSMPAAPRIWGLTNTIYTMVKKVVIPAIVSVRAVVPCCLSLNTRPSKPCSTSRPDTGLLIIRIPKRGMDSRQLSYTQNNWSRITAARTRIPKSLLK